MRRCRTVWTWDRLYTCVAAEGRLHEWNARQCQQRALLRIRRMPDCLRNPAEPRLFRSQIVSKLLRMPACTYNPSTCMYKVIRVTVSHGIFPAFLKSPGNVSSTVCAASRRMLDNAYRVAGIRRRAEGCVWRAELQEWTCCNYSVLGLSSLTRLWDLTRLIGGKRMTLFDSYRMDALVQRK